MHDKRSLEPIILKILMLGDSIGKTGRSLFARHVPTVRTEYDLDAVIVNGENSADDGMGITPQDADFFFAHGADVITTGNHVWDKKDIIPYIAAHDKILRPANFSLLCPGKGMTFFTCKKGYVIGVMNLMGRVFMAPGLDCPFKKAITCFEEAAAITPIMFIDFHAEATAEKLGLAYFLDGKVTGIVGTHTHTQTNDGRILPEGTGYMTDLGMIGSVNSVLGFCPDEAIYEQTTGMPIKFKVETKAPYIITGALFSVDALTGKTVALEPFYLFDEEPLEECS